MKRCPNCHRDTIKKPQTSKKSESSSKVTTIIGKKPPVGEKKNKI